MRIVLLTNFFSSWTRTQDPLSQFRTRTQDPLSQFTQDPLPQFRQEEGRHEEGVDFEQARLSNRQTGG